MNLDSELQDKLDTPVKSFEVAFRSYVSTAIITAYPLEDSLKNEIVNRSNKLKESKAIFSGKFSSEIKSILGGREWKSFWDNIVFAKDCYDKRKHDENHDVNFVSQILLMTYIFQDIFQTLILQFTSPSAYLSYSQKYYEVRNGLSHRASSIIDDTDAKGCLIFIKNASELISSDYYWYCSKTKIDKMVDEYYQLLNAGALSIDNLDTAPFPSNKIVCREPEISDLFKYVCAWDETKKLRNKKHIICISGYGGIGKTSLVLEFVLQLLSKMKQNEYLGFRPSFILFYSAKEQMLDINEETGSIKKKRLKSQFHGLDTFKALLFNDLEISDFNDYWKTEGLIIVDNLESLNTNERKRVVDFLYEELPSSVQAIITTRIPENDVDYSMPINGFRNEAGITFIKQYSIQNKFDIDLTNEQIGALVKYSFGNSLVLVLSLKRLISKKTTYNSIISEMKKLPSDNTESIITQFMFQNTINEILTIYPDCSSLIKSVLLCLSLSSEPLSASIILAAHKGTNLIISEVESILKLLTEYLVTDKVNDCYIINEFASKFILINMIPSMDERKMWEQRLISALNDNRVKAQKINELKKDNEQLRQVLEDWNTEDEDAMTIYHAFDLYTIKYKITSSNADYELDQLRLEVENIQHNFGAHPYLFYQYARILNELRQDGLIGDDYQELTVQNYEKCIMIIDDVSYSKIKSTKTYPSILWIYSIFLYESSEYEKASNYSLLSINKYKELKLKNKEYNDALAIYCLAEIQLYKQTGNKQHLLNAKKRREEIIKMQYTILHEHLERLNKELIKYKHLL